MNKYDTTFDEKLLGLEKINPSLKERYEKEKKNMLERKLTGWTKMSHVIGLLMGIGFTLLFGTIAIIIPSEFPLWGRSMFAIGALFGLAIIAFEIFIFKKGKVDLKKDEVAAAGLGWGLIVIAGTIVLVYSGKLPDRVVGVHMLVSLIFFEVASASMLLKAFLQRSELNTREKLLEIELRLAELSEKLESKNKT
ncbi:MAG: hypothetical protein JW787_12380 [Sedimentisphaerales bacterium]|nr:hypothetical protein [Sedimentisphaerales bacterium]